MLKGNSPRVQIYTVREAVEVHKNLLYFKKPKVLPIRPKNS